jgi:hypothetical protein
MICCQQSENLIGLFVNLLRTLSEVFLLDEFKGFERCVDPPLFAVTQILICSLRTPEIGEQSAAKVSPDTDVDFTKRINDGRMPNVWG